MTSPSDASAPDEQSDEQSGDTPDAPDSPDTQGGQVSETAAMTPQGGADGTPGTDDGVPPAEDAGTEPGAAPQSYGD